MPHDASRKQTTLLKPDGTVISNVYDSAGRIWAVVVALVATPVAFGDDGVL